MIEFTITFVTNFGVFSNVTGKYKFSADTIADYGYSYAVNSIRYCTYCNWWGVYSQLCSLKYAITSVTSDEKCYKKWWLRFFLHMYLFFFHIFMYFDPITLYTLELISLISMQYYIYDDVVTLSFINCLLVIIFKVLITYQ